MSYKWTNQEIANKADHEGGILEVLEWGLSYNEIEDEQVAELWKKLEDMLPVLYAIRKLLPEPYEDY